MNSSTLLAAMVDGSHFVAVLAIISGSLIAVVSIVAGALRSAAKARHVEQSRREIAAYVAEGSISPDDAAKLLQASPSVRGGCGG